jgi:hypothetical protein
MSKKTAAAAAPFDDSSFQDMELPEGGSVITGDIAGYWDSNRSSIRFIPRSVKIFDGQIDSTKVSSLVLGELTQPCQVYTKTDAGSREYSLVTAGQMIGIWYKPGMRAIIGKCGVDCYIRQEGEKDTHKLNPMKLYTVVAGPGGSRIPIIEDSREDSQDVLTPFHDRSKRLKGSKPTSRPTDPIEEDDLFE